MTFERIAVMRPILITLAAFAAASALANPAAAQESGADRASSAVREADAPKASVDPSYVLGPGDVLEIGIVGRADFNSRIRVAADGTVLLPYVGKLAAAKRSVLEFSDDVRQALVRGGYFANPEVLVEVVGVSSRYATVLGFVTSPGLIPLDREYRLSEILARVGGRSGSGADYVLLTHGAGGAQERYSIAALASGAAEKDPIVESGDKIYVPSAEDEVFYLSGAVHSPGPYHLARGMTLRMAIAKGGGVTENGSEGRVSIIRSGKKVKLKPDDPVAIGDVITVGERLF
jgi:polysaccharide export outer membrane protein